MAPCVITVPNLRTGYVDICQRVVTQGAVVRPRGMLTHELTDVTIQIMDPTDALPIGVGRNLNPAIAAAEALQLIGGISTPELLIKIAPTFAQFKDGDRFWGAYGERVRLPLGFITDGMFASPPLGQATYHQAQLVVERLRKDPDSRQALIVLWRPELDLEEGKHDYPCTVMLMFLVRNGKLQLHTTMRSNDVWWGLTYDAFQFTQLQLTVAHALNVPHGPYFHHAVSLHAYERDFEAITKLRYPKTATTPDLPRGVHPSYTAKAPWMHVEADAQRILQGAKCLTEQHSWWGKTLESFL